MQKIVMFTDPNKDVDDLIALIMLNNMKRSNILEIEGIVTTHGDLQTVYKRACYAQGVSKLLGNNIDVCAGIPELNNPKSNAFFEAKGLNEIMASCDLPKVKTNSEEYLKDIFLKASPKSLDLLVIAQMTDIWNFANKYPQLFIDKTKTVNIMGMYEEKEGKLVPDNSANNAYDEVSSKGLYKFLQANNLPTKFINRFGAMQVPVNMAFYESFKKSDDLIGDFVYDAEQKSIKGLYEAIISGQHLARLTPEWFYKTFTSLDESKYEYYKQGGLDNKIVEEIMSNVSKLNLYDPLTLLATIDYYKPLFNVQKNNNFEVLMPSDKEGIYTMFNYWTTGNLEINNNLKSK